MNLSDIYMYLDLRSRYNSDFTEQDWMAGFISLVKNHMTSSEIFEVLEVFTDLEKKPGVDISSQYLSIKNVLDKLAHEKILVEFSNGKN